MSEEIKKDVNVSEESSKKQPLPLWRHIAFILVILALIVMGGIMLAGFAMEKMLGSRIEAISKAGYPVSFAQLAGSSEIIRTEDAGPIYTAAITSLTTQDIQNIIQASTFYRNVITADAMD